ncbi:hypothetical protein [Pseudoalteromonas sp. T1lg24]|uniref:hypothetical protein n=1 Tax=Pseudoalteromonas sp. T1lg24 TaxID=2077099 RepID=UPI00131A0339|nr:hypothetical protein [Pseudoalteromonas sp. T1lg24]
MHRFTNKIKKELRQKKDLQSKVDFLKNSYSGEDCIILTCGPSLADYWNAELEMYLKDKLVISVKQTFNLAPSIVDFHILNSWNYEKYEYGNYSPIVISERNEKDPETAGLHADLLFNVPSPSDFWSRLATTYEFDNYTFDKILDRPWGPGVMHELVFYLCVHLGVKNIVAFGWDLGVKNSKSMPHFFDVKKDPSNLKNKPGIIPEEVDDIANSTAALYYWLRAKGIGLAIVSEQSLVADCIPRLNLKKNEEEHGK